MNKIQAQRLLNVASALREAPISRQFDMDTYVHDCGAPACALGHYAGRPDLQRLLTLRITRHSYGVGQYAMTYKGSAEWADWGDIRVLEHFGLAGEEGQELFDAGGCGNAQTAIQAANYIENFLDEHDWTVV